MIEAVIFDGDQTLWDFQKIMKEALLAVLDELRLERPGQPTAEIGLRDLSADRNHVASELEGIEYNLARLRTLGFERTLRRLRQMGGGSTEADDTVLAERLTTSYFRHRDRDPALFEDTLSCLIALRPHYRLGLLSNGSRLPDTVGLGGYFESVVFAQDHRVAKPDRAIFSVVEHELRVTPDACVLVGDHPLNDVVGAKRAGWQAVWIDREGAGVFVPSPGCAEEPDAVITSLEQLPDLLASL